MYIYICQQTKPPLFQLTACRLFGAKPLPEPMMTHCQLGLWKQRPVKMLSKLEYFHWQNCIKDAEVVTILSKNKKTIEVFIEMHTVPLVNFTLFASIINVATQNTVTSNILLQRVVSVTLTWRMFLFSYIVSDQPLVLLYRIYGARFVCEKIVTGDIMAVKCA